jgi:hypothetical protein
MKTEYGSIEEWQARARELFGNNPEQWKFTCPSCGHVASVGDWRKAGASEGEIAFSCIGRHSEYASEFGRPPGPCNYAGGGLFRLNPVQVGNCPDRIFQFADPET